MNTNAIATGQSPHPAGSKETIAIEDVPIAYVEMDASGRIVRANTEAQELYSITGEVLVGQLGWELLAKDEQEQFRREFDQELEIGENLRVVRRMVLTASKGPRIFELHRNLIFDQQGNATGMRIGLLDVTQMQQELELARTTIESHLSVLESISDAVIATDALGYIQYANPAVEHLLGIDRRSLIGAVIDKRLRIISFNSEQRAHFSFLAELGGQCQGTAKILNADLRVLDVEITTSPVIDKFTGLTCGVVALIRKPVQPPT